MATRAETNVTIAAIIVLRPSTRTWSGTSRPPTVNQLATVHVRSGSAEASVPSDHRNARAIPATTGRWAWDRSRRAPNAAIAAPRSGKTGISQADRTKKPGFMGQFSPSGVREEDDSRREAWVDPSGQPPTSPPPFDPGLYGVVWLDAGGDQVRIRFRAGDRLDGLGLLGDVRLGRGRHARLADVLPERDIQG